jgi:hypothetical protein
VVIESPLRIVIGGMGPLQFFRTFRRWILFSEGGLSFRFTWPNWVARRLLLGGLGGPRRGARHRPPRCGGAALLPIAFSVFTQASLQRAYHGPAHPPAPALGAGGDPPRSAGLVQIAAKLKPPGGLAGPELRPGRRGPARGPAARRGGGT